VILARERPIRQAGTRLHWRSPRLRAAVFQTVIVAGVALAVLALARRAADRLAALGINTGFGFLNNRAGFNIGEAPLLPAPNAAWLGLLVAVLLGLALALASIRVADAAGRSLRDRPALRLVTTIALLAPPVTAGWLLADDLDLVAYTADRSFAFALAIGAINTLRVSVIALVLSTLAGLAGATLRLSGNWLLARLGGLYVELVRNLPLLVHLFFWYFGVLRALPGVRGAVNPLPGVYLSNRGLVVPALEAGPGAVAVSLGVLLGLVLAWLLARRLSARDLALPTRSLIVIAAALVPPALAWSVAGQPLALLLPELRGFNFQGGMHVTPEFFTLVVALSVYHGAYNAEIIRSGIQSVPKGQLEAAHAVGLPAAPTFWLIALPQALRLIIPPLISRYLGLLKSSSLAVAIGYPEIVSIGQSITYATGQALEMVSLTMLFYLGINLTIALVMNWYNVRLQPAAAG
jgi:general L-amino acid transport system permease protein